ncbi:elongation factor P hydroxylase [Carnimonas nigrificans]|uniref:elongation factor P hydroxylase n=1 Tax=Carnimonas nigrificans TaxID=64323 RepID=UPI00046FA9B5|nr:elongation factor P hydroxylase [Carnimonas nigrificans]
MSNDIEDESAQVERLISLFDAMFAERYCTRLVRGKDEPIYLPADAQHDHHRIIFAHGYFASALHEISHWCVAGPARRQQEDFGYWYIPDGRSQQQQEVFEQAEVEPQAIELLLTQACGRRFNVSVDNLNPDVEVDRDAFLEKVEARARERREYGLPVRVAVLCEALKLRFGQQRSEAEALQAAHAIFAQRGTPP